MHYPADFTPRFTPRITSRHVTVALAIATLGLMLNGCRCPQSFQGTEYVGEAPQHPGSDVIVYTFPESVDGNVNPVYLDVNDDGLVTVTGIRFVGDDGVVPPAALLEAGSEPDASTTAEPEDDSPDDSDYYYDETLLEEQQ